MSLSKSKYIALLQLWIDVCLTIVMYGSANLFALSYLHLSSGIVPCIIVKCYLY